MTDEAKTPDNESFAEKISQDIDPWEVYGAPPPTPHLEGREYYDEIDLKKIPELDTYEELATQWDAVTEESSELHRERWERERPEAKAEREETEEKIEYLRDWAEDDTSLTNQLWPGVVEQAAEELEAETQRPTVDLSTMNEVYKDGVTPDPQIADKVRGHFEGHEGPGQGQPDTYEQLEADYKDALWARDQELMKNYESQQREAVEDAVEDVGEAAADFVKDHPVLGDVLQGAAEQAEIEANIEMHPPENDPGMIE